jgi:hypothetical protein
VFFLLLGCSLYLPGQNSTDATPFSSSGSSAYMRQSDGAHVTDNRTFEFANVLHDDGSGYIRLLLLKNVHNEHIDGHEETTGQMARFKSARRLNYSYGFPRLRPEADVQSTCS